MYNNLKKRTKMRKLSLAMMCIATAALMTMVSCRKPVNGLVTPGEARTVTFTATTESNDGSKTEVDDHKILWKSGDKISVNGEEMTLASEAGSTEGTFTGTITTAEEYYIGYPAATTTYTSPNTLKLGIPSTQTYSEGNVVVPMAAYTKEEGNISFNNAVNVLQLNLYGNNDDASKLTSIVLSHASANLSGDITVTFYGGEPKFSYATGSKHATVNFSGDDGQLTQETKSVYIVLPKIESGDIKVTFFCANGKCMEKTIPWNEGLKEVNYLVSNKTPLPVNATTAPLFVPCDFTVSAGADGVAGTTDDVKVLFSRGNLWYGEKGESKTKTWNLEDNQWDFKFKEEGEYFYWDPDHISHFKWGSDTEAIEDTDTSPTGYFFATSNFPVEGETWFTLSYNEWSYLLGCNPETGAQTENYGRENAMNLCGWRTVAGVNGLVILPDNTENPSKVIAGITTAENLAAAGAVFLPAPGHRSGSDLWWVGKSGYYWSSTPYDDSKNQSAYFMSFDSDFVGAHFDNRDCGYCVRLVR